MEPPRPIASGAHRGRKRKSTEKTQKPKREPQRGMGVEKLEQMIRKMTEPTQPHHQHLTQYYFPSSGFVGYGSVGQLGFNQMGPIGGSGFGASRELASVPNFNQFWDHWGLNMNRPLNSGGFDKVKSPSLESSVGGNIDQDAEVKAVHRKGNSRVLEYEFFPQHTNGYKNNTDPKDDETPSLSLTTMTPNSPSKSIDLSLKL